MSTQQLTLLWTPWTIVLGTLFVLATAAVCFISWRRSGYSKRFGLLELLRFGIVMLAVILLNQPEWVQQFRPDKKPTVAVLFDDSASMSTRDVADASGAATTRRESIEALTNADSWNPLRETMNISIQSFDTLRAAKDANKDKTEEATEATTSTSQPASTSKPSAGGGSDLHTPLVQAGERNDNLRAVVMISDGDWNEGSPPVNAATQLRQDDIPVFTVSVGSATRLPDVEMLSLDAPTFGVSGKTVRIPFTIESSLPREYVTTATLKVSDGEILTKEVRIAAMGRTTDAILWKPQAEGDYNVKVSVQVHGDETLTDNNSLEAPISIRSENLRVLVVESYPRWEYRYLRNALSRDPGVDVSCLLFHPQLKNVGGGNADYITEFPAGLDELSEYDVVFLGDVGLDDNQLTPEQCRLLKGLVEFQASGLVFIPGWQGRQHTLQETELSDLYPVLLDDGQPDGWGSRTPGHFELTELGRRSLLTKLADTQDENMSVWENLPGFQWYAPIVRAKAGCEVLAVHQDIVNENGRLPLLVARTFGAGKVLFMGTDGAWRWREGVEDKYHYRFWGQVVRWMAYQRNMAKGESMRFHFSPDQPQLQQTLSMHANVMETSGEPLTKGEVTARITAPSGKIETVRFNPSTEDEWGVFRGRYATEEAGRHEVTLHCKQTGSSLDASFFVQGDTIERMGKPARPEVLEEISRVTNGKMLTPDDLDEVLRSVAAIPEPPVAIRRTSLWSHPWMVGTMVFLLGAFWVGRKAGGLI